MPLLSNKSSEELSYHPSCSPSLTTRMTLVSPDLSSSVRKRPCANENNNDNDNATDDVEQDNHQDDDMYMMVESAATSSFVLQQQQQQQQQQHDSLHDGHTGFVPPPLGRNNDNDYDYYDNDDDVDDPGVSPPPYDGTMTTTTTTTTTESSGTTSTAGTTHTISTTSRYAPPTTRLRDIIGHGAVKIRLDELLLPLALPTDVTRRIWTGLRRGGGGGSGTAAATSSWSTTVLLFGPPGCGKTRLAQAVAGEAQAAYVEVGPSDILSKFVGESEAAVRDVFETARLAAAAVECRTAVVFWDEIDALGQSRGGAAGGGGGAAAANGGPNIAANTDGCGRRILTELLLQFNKITSPSPSPQRVQPFQDTSNSVCTTINNDNNGNDVRILLLAATNRPEDCDPALLRRFGMRLYVGCPTIRDRRKLLRHYLRDIPHTLSRADIRHVAAAATDGWSGAELEHLAREAVMAPVRECLQHAAQQRRALRKRKRKRFVVHTASAQRKQDEDELVRLSTTTTTSGGTTLESENEEDEDEYKATEQARQTLLQNLESLRPVTVQDFISAIAFILGQTSESTDNAPRYDSSSSSSSEDDDDHEGDDENNEI
eukprot:scaffold12181_cov159-Amphora_coffeaeformis.AAC.4